MKSLTAAIAGGLKKPLSIKASLQGWLGVPISLQNGDFWREWAGAGSFTGKRVTVDQALQVATVWACVRLISGTLATLPLGFYERNADGSRTSATKHPLYEVLHNQPNADMTAVVFWEVSTASMLLWGNVYIEIERSRNTVIALNFLHPARITLRKLKGGGYEYRYRDNTNGVERVISEADMMHVPAFSLDGVVGVSPIAYGANVFGNSIETDRTSTETFQGSLRSPGILTMDMTLSPTQREQLRAHVKDVSDRGGIMVVEKGTDFKKLGFDPVSAELLASRAWNVEEMCRWFDVDPVMVGHGSKDSNWGTGLEQKMLWFITLTLRKWAVRIEQGVRKCLLTPAERLKYFAEFNMEGLLRGDSAARAAFYSTMTQNGIFTRDRCRQLENEPPMGGNAAVLTVQSNLLPIDKLGENVPTQERRMPQENTDVQIKVSSQEAIGREELDLIQEGQQKIALALSDLSRSHEAMQAANLALAKEATRSSKNSATTNDSLDQVLIRIEELALADDNNARALKRAYGEVAEKLETVAEVYKMPKRAVKDENGDVIGVEVVESL